METLWDSLQVVLGLGEGNLTWWQLGLRALMIYLGGLALVRLGKRRFMGQYSAFDMILGVTMGALLASAATEAAVFLNALVLVILLGALHWLSAFASYHWEFVDRILKGKEYELIGEGKLKAEGLRQGYLSHSDLGQALRKEGIEEVKQVKRACMERSGEISFIKDEELRTEGTGTPRIVEVEVQEGVQRIVLEFKA